MSDGHVLGGRTDSFAARGQSEVIGVVLLLAITIISVTAILVVGSSVLAGAQSDSHVSQTENSMSQMASKASLVALDDSETYDFDLGDLGDGSAEVREDAGEVTLIHTDENGDETELHSEPYGAVVATVDGTEVAYQGGGVWKKDGERSSMISPPEYHYQDRTLTFPIVRVTGEDRAAGSVQGQLSKNGSQQIFPDDDELTNPLENGSVTVEITSEYYHGWYDFFDGRSDGEVEKYDDNTTVVVELQVPIEESINTPVAVTDKDGLSQGDEGQIEGPNPVRGTSYIAPDDRIEERIADCEDGECKDLTSEIY